MRNHFEKLHTSCLGSTSGTVQELFMTKAALKNIFCLLKSSRPFTNLLPCSPALRGTGTETGSLGWSCTFREASSENSIWSGYTKLLQIAKDCGQRWNASEPWKPTAFQFWRIDCKYIMNWGLTTVWARCFLINSYELVKTRNNEALISMSLTFKVILESTDTRRNKTRPRYRPRRAFAGQSITEKLCLWPRSPSAHIQLQLTSTRVPEQHGWMSVWEVERGWIFPLSHLWWWVTTFPCQELLVCLCVAASALSSVSLWLRDLRGLLASASVWHQPWSLNFVALQISFH